MLPLVLDEEHVFIFKFWFADTIQNGMHYQNELFCQLMIVEAQQRSQLYQLGCKFAQKGGFAVTCCSTNCRLWGSLRDDFVKELLINPSMLNLPIKLLVEEITPFHQ